jgi:hypothetical protein
VRSAAYGPPARSAKPAGRSGPDAAGARLHGAGCRRARGCLRSLPWERFQRGSAGNRSPTPAPGQATALAPGRTVVRAAADPAPAGGPDPASLRHLSRRAVHLSPGGQGTARRARTGRRGSPARITAAPVTAGRTPACPRAGPPGRGTALPSPAIPSTRRRRRARSAAARRRDSSTASTRSASTRSASTRSGSLRGRPARAPGSPRTMDRGTVPGLMVTVSLARDPAVSLARATRALARASPGQGPRAAGRPATRRPASSPARRGRDRVLLAAPARPGPCRPARTPRVSRLPRPGRCHPATTRRAWRRPARRPRASSPRLASSPRARRSLERSLPGSSLKAGQAPKRPARPRRGPAASQGTGPAGPCLLTAPGGIHDQGRDAGSTTIPTGC